MITDLMIKAVLLQKLKFQLLPRFWKPSN